MANENCELLFEYLRSILYDKNIRKLDLDELDPDFRELGEGMQYLARAVCEMKEYSEALSVGRLSVLAPPRENLLCENLKNIHANLNHLTWQAKQVAQGDYSQTVSYLGEFSDAFNEMTRQLKERESLFRETAELERTRASHDMLTGVGNRYYLQFKMEEMISSNENIIFCYCDLDHLKEINDTYGHSEGDWYICHFTDLVKQSIRHDDIFARVGGDEFCLIMSKCSRKNADRKMRKIRRVFGECVEKPYVKSFSYGIVEVPGRHEGMTAEELIRQADTAMYIKKRDHRQQYRQMTN